jgi:hypothetical protein
MTNTTSFQPISSPVTVSGIERVDIYNYVLYPVWALLYFNPGSSTKTAITITPAS